MSESEGMQYPNSQADTQLMVNEQGDWVYPSAASTGYVEIELPTLPGSPNPTERLHIRDFGGHVTAKLESAMNTGYLRQQSPAQVFKHYVAVAKGASLMDEQALKRMETLASEFESEPEKQQYFEMVVRPYLVTLQPKRRQA